MDKEANGQSTAFEQPVNERCDSAKPAKDAAEESPNRAPKRRSRRASARKAEPRKPKGRTRKVRAAGEATRATGNDAPGDPAAESVASDVDPGDSVGLEREFDRLAKGLCADGSKLAMGEALLRMKEIHERLYPESALGGARGKAGGGKVANDPNSGSFVSVVVQRTGIARSTVYAVMDMAAAIDERAREVIHGTPLANKAGLLARIGKLPKPKLHIDVAKIASVGAGLKAAAKQLAKWEGAFGIGKKARSAAGDGAGGGTDAAGGAKAADGYEIVRLSRSATTRVSIRGDVTVVKVTKHEVVLQVQRRKTSGPKATAGAKRPDPATAPEPASPLDRTEGASAAPPKPTQPPATPEGPADVAAPDGPSPTQHRADETTTIVLPLSTSEPASEEAGPDEPTDAASPLAQRTAPSSGERRIVPADCPIGDRIVLGDCLTVLQRLANHSVDAIVTDPPYGLGTKEPSGQDIDAYIRGGRLDTGGDFMSYDWEIPPVQVWVECMRVLRPGGYLLSFAGTRTWDIVSVGIRAAGFDNRDTIATKFGSGTLQWIHGQGFPKSMNIAKAIRKLDIPNAEELAKKWEGYGTALKPAWEPILCFRSPLEGTLERQAVENGTVAFNVDAARVRHANAEDLAQYQAMVAALKAKGGSLANSWKNTSDLSGATDYKEGGRGPSKAAPVIDRGIPVAPEASFFYAAKASPRERTLGGRLENAHPTVKPLDVMRYLVRTVVPAGGIVLDPFAGSGTTIEAAILERRGYFAIERDPMFHAIAAKRASLAQSDVENGVDNGAAKKKRRSLGKVAPSEEPLPSTAPASRGGPADVAEAQSADAPPASPGRSARELLRE
jgi:DNA modification methylase